MSEESPGKPDKTASPRRGTRKVAHRDLGVVSRKSGQPVQGTPRRPASGLLLAVVLLVSAVIGTLAVVALHHPAPILDVSTRADRAVIFVLDGAGPNVLTNVHTPALTELADRGVRYPNAWLGQLSPSVITSNATLATGLYPGKHGLLGDVWTDPKTHQLVHLADSQDVRLGSIDQRLEEQGLTPLAATVKSRYPGSKILSVGGVGCASASAAGSWLADYVLCPARYKHRWVAADVAGHEPPPGFLSNPAWWVPVAHNKSLASTVEGWRLGEQDDWVARAALWAMQRAHPRLTVINFPELEALVRWVPPDSRSQVFRRLVSGIDRNIAAVIAATKKQRVYSHTVFLVTSDQSGAAVSNRVNASSIREAIAAAGGETVYAQTDASAFVGVRDRLQAEPVAQALEAEHQRFADAIYFKVPGGQNAAYRRQYVNPDVPRAFPQAIDYLMGTLASSRAPDVAEIFAPATTAYVGRYAGFEPSGSLYGAQWPNQHVPLLISGAGVAQSGIRQFPARLVDIAPTVSALLGAGRMPADGVILADALAHPPAGAVERQRQTNKKMRPLVMALQQR